MMRVHRTREEARAVVAERRALRVEAAMLAYRLEAQEVRMRFRDTLHLDDVLCPTPPAPAPAPIVVDSASWTGRVTEQLIVAYRQEGERHGT